MSGGGSPTNGDDDRWRDGIESEIRAIKADVRSLRDWRNWVLGGVAALGMMGGAFAKTIAGIFTGNHP